MDQTESKNNLKFTAGLITENCGRKAHLFRIDINGNETLEHILETCETLTHPKK